MALERVVTSQDAPARPLAPGTRIGACYVNRRFIGHEEGVELYDVTDRVAGRRALIVMTRRSDAAMARLELAALAMKMLGCREVRDVGEMEDGTPFVVMDLDRMGRA